MRRLIMILMIIIISASIVYATTIKYRLKDGTEIRGRFIGEMLSNGIKKTMIKVKGQDVLLDNDDIVSAETQPTTSQDKAEYKEELLAQQRELDAQEAEKAKAEEAERAKVALEKDEEIYKQIRLLQYNSASRWKATGQEKFEIEKLRQEIFRRHPDWGEGIKQIISASKIQKGMTKDQAFASWGYPSGGINKSVGSWGTHLQCIYGEQYLYFENDILTSWQTTE